MQTIQPIPDINSTPQNQVYTPDDWKVAVGNADRVQVTTFQNIAPGKHTLKVSMITPGLVFEKFVSYSFLFGRERVRLMISAREVVDVGYLQPSYLGPPESSQV